MLHSNVAMFSSPQALRTIETACTSSDVSITTMGVEELINTFRRSSPSVMESQVLFHSPIRNRPLFVGHRPSWMRHLERRRIGSGQDDAMRNPKLNFAPASV